MLWTGNWTLHFINNEMKHIKGIEYNTVLYNHTSQESVIVNLILTDFFPINTIFVIHDNHFFTTVLLYDCRWLVAQTSCSSCVESTIGAELMCGWCAISGSCEVEAGCSSVFVRITQEVYYSHYRLQYCSVISTCMQVVLIPDLYNVKRY